MTARKVADLLGAELDCAVAKAMGLRWSFVPTDPEFGMRRALCVAEITPNPHIDGFPVFAPSTRWEHGGPIIQRERIAIHPPGDHLRDEWWAGFDMKAGDGPGIYMDHDACGPTALLAAMRAFVRRHFGETVDLP